MKKNMGKIDRVIRIIVGVMLLVSFLVSKDSIKYIFLVGLVPLMTGVVGYCPLYSLFKFDK